MHCLTFKGVDHAARPTWKLRDTVRFYRDLMGLSLVHAISARGWGTDTHPDFLHFFFDSGNGSSIAFFYYIGSKEPTALKAHQVTRPAPDDHVFDATHVSWLVDSRDDLQALRLRLEAHGIEVSPDTRHETIESIYFRDPNGYFLEVTIRARPLLEIDAIDAARTIEAGMQLEAERETNAHAFRSIDQVWQRKAALYQVAMGAAQ